MLTKRSRRPQKRSSDPRRIPVPARKEPGTNSAVIVTGLSSWLASSCPASSLWFVAVEFRKFSEALQITVGRAQASPPDSSRRYQVARRPLMFVGPRGTNPTLIRTF